MPPRTLPFVLLAAGVVAAGLLTRRPAGATAWRQTLAHDSGAVRRFTVESDVPSLGLRRGERLRVEPDALVRIGDVVALVGAAGEIVLTRFHDELMHCTAGLVVRERSAVSV